MSMTPLNPLTGALFAGSQVQDRQVREKVEQARRDQALSRSVAARDDEIEHQVENTQDVPEIEDEPHEAPDGKRRRRRTAESEKDAEKDSPGLDVTA